MLVWSLSGARAMQWVWCFSCGLESEVWAGDGEKKTFFETSGHDIPEARVHKIVGESGLRLLSKVLIGCIDCEV